MRFIKPSEPAPRNGGRAPAYDKTIERTIERKRSTYFQLKCGHYTTWDSDEFYSNNRPSRNKMWCENCGRWIEKMDKPAPLDYPDEPLF